MTLTLKSASLPLESADSSSDHAKISILLCGLTINLCMKGFSHLTVWYHAPSLTEEKDSHVNLKGVVL